MSGRRRIAVVFGTRPEAIKLAPLVLELRRRPEVECRVAGGPRGALDPGSRRLLRRGGTGHRGGPGRHVDGLLGGNPYGAGKASRRIADVLCGQEPEPFLP